ncbi:MAG: hypothetical protein HYX59_15715 [Elusimicrobia bacterium]|nr:hypothetical protein [Elusimicrobiota bacterium]
MRIRIGPLLAVSLGAFAAVGCDERTLEGCGPNDKPSAAPAAAPAQPEPRLSCPGNPDNWVPSKQRQGPTRLAEVQAAAEATQKAYPHRFNGDKLIGECHASASLFFDELAKELRRRGVCAWTGPDAIHPASTVPGIAEEYHIITYGGCTLWPASRNNYKGDWVIR